MGVKNSDNGNKKPFLYYYIIVLLVVMVLNALVFPSIMERSVEVPFSEFTAQLEAGKIKEAYVSSDNTEIDQKMTASFSGLPSPTKREI